MNEVIPINWDKGLSHIIKVIGVGGGGNNAVKNMYEKGIEGVDFIICNTDAQVLNKSIVPNKIQIGTKLTGGLGTGCNPELGRQAALESLDEIKNILEKNTKMLFIATGLGGGTGTGAAPVIAKEAKSMDILTVAIVTLPFKDEGEEPYKRALDGLWTLRENVDSLLIINNEKLYEIYPDLSIFEAFPKADDIVTTAVKSIAEIITVEGYINVDFADVKMVMSNSDMALMGLGRAAGEDRVRKAAEQALKSPLLNNNDISGAKNILVNVSSGLKNPLKAFELRELMDYINTASGRGANFKRGVAEDISLDAESSDAEISVTIIATGFSMNNSFPDIDDDIKCQPKWVENPNDKEPKVHVLSDETDDTYINANTITVKQYGNVFDLTPEMPEIVETPETTTREAAADPQKTRSLFTNASNGSGVVNTWGSMKEVDITMMERIPAYERANAKIIPGTTAGKEVSKYRIDESGGTHVLNENNSYPDKDVD
ncbi:MAG: cell division protein FtsZ [Prevotellaceae bacterium]|jgi:cell division protein FtsZ|nr:cell division protein FtsZ [Prevotellaceae bacterium]